VAHYSTRSALLTLVHDHPPGTPKKVLVDVRLLLNILKPGETRVGEWINVIGYVVAPPEKGSNTPSTIQSSVLIQALILWSSGPLKIDGYERSMDKQNHLDTKGKLG
jgi:hypothetical protein